MSNLTAVVQALAGMDKKDLATRLTDVFKKNMSYLSEFEQVSQCYILTEEYEKAIKVMETALPLSPNPQTSFMYRNILADLYIKNNKPNRALIYINVNEKLSPNKELAYLRLRAEESLINEKEKAAGIAPTGYWDKNLGNKYHQHSHELAAWIADFFETHKQVHDFGCGWGKYLKDLELRGFQKLIGYEGVVPDNKFFKNIVVQDLAEKFDVSDKGNVICLEVAEHIPSDYSDVFLDNIANACDGKLVMSWAVVGQGGTGHVNCQNNDHAIKAVENKGFKYLPYQTESARNAIGQFCSWFRKSLLIFERKA